MEELKKRNLVYQCTNENLLNSLEKGGVEFYIGIDATSDSMHIGHLLSFMVAKRLEILGNKPHVIIGDMTARIGDPSGKREERTLISEDIIDRNALSLEKQIKKIFGNNYKIHKNKDWLNINMVEFLRDYGKQFNLNTMLAKDSVKSRIDSGISFTEFTYQILQAMDFIQLAKEQNIELQIGGQDQWGNITAGIEFARKKKIDKNLWGFTIPLLTKNDGTKFGKTESGTKWLNKDKTSEYELYQYLLNIDDSEVEKLLLSFSMKSVNEINEIVFKHKNEPFKKYAQKFLADEMILFIHGKDGLDDAIKITDSLFKGKVSDLSKKQIVSLSKSLNLVNTKSNDVAEMIVEAGLSSSKREAREFIKNKAIKINDQVVESELLAIKPIWNNYYIIKRGKRKFGILKK